MNANEPGFGGRRVMDECVATAETLSLNVPLLDRSILAVFTGPFVPALSR